MLRILAFIGASILLAQQASAAPVTEKSLDGVWQGTIGPAPIRVCFNQERGPFGLYFYLSHLNQIPLRQVDAAKAVLVEGARDDDPAAARWSLPDVGRDAISGSWSQGKRNLPIALKRVAGRFSEDETPCGSEIFHRPQLAGITTVRKAATLDGHSYTRLILDHHGHFGDSISVETFALDGLTPAIARINATLAEALDPRRDDSWFACIRMAGNSSSNGGDEQSLTEPRMISGKYLSVRQQIAGFCGGAHPDSTDVPLLFDLMSGREVTLFDWFNERAVKREHLEGEAAPFVTLQPAFRKMLTTGWKADSECREAVASQDVWSVALTRAGFVLAPDLPHVVQACGEEFTLSFAKAEPFLNAGGTAEVAAFNRR